MTDLAQVHRLLPKTTELGSSVKDKATTRREVRAWFWLVEEEATDVEITTFLRVAINKNHPTETANNHQT